MQGLKDGAATGALPDPAQGHEVVVERDGTTATVWLNRPGAYNALSESVLSQLHRNWELFIVDDGSTDETAIVAETLRLRDTGRIQVIHLALEHLIVELVEEELARGA